MKAKINRKTFIKSTALLGIGTLALGAKASMFDPKTENMSLNEIRPVNGKYELPALGYAYNSLEPVIDAQTMEIHHSKHHQAYVNKLNEALEQEPSLKNKSLEELMMNLSGMPASVKNTIRNHGGGHWNHSFFWKSLKTGTSMGPNFMKMATGSFGSVETFKSTFEKLAMGVFGSGWVWLILQNKQLKITTSANQDNPMMNASNDPEMKLQVILGIDLWEHAYYLKHQNKRADYVKGFWNAVNWDEIETLLK